MPRFSLHVEGVVQGVGFRPFVARRATALGLSGFVKNGRGGVEIEIAGPEAKIQIFCDSLWTEVPPPGAVTSLSRKELEDSRDESEGFRVLPSDEGALPLPILPPDLATCAECMAETLASSGRRSRYPFTCCARCGPRYSIIEALPYDRERTSLRSFPPCEECRREYEDPSDRRYHAEPIACPRCGPKITLLSGQGEPIASEDRALRITADLLRVGQIVALRGLGGFQLLALATDPMAIQELRKRKDREEKPFAVLFATLMHAERYVALSAEEKRVLSGPEAPIVLARRREGALLAQEVAPKNPLLGVMLPATPLHRMLAESVGLPLVCTSGNLSGEPLCVETNETLERLGAIADVFLTHDRPIARPIDDAVVREGPRGMQVLRRARGQAPLPVGAIDDKRSIVGLGAFLKSTITLSVEGHLVTSQHLGDMDDPRSIDLLSATVRDMTRFFDVRPSVIACDMHPDFPSTRLAERLADEWRARLIRVQHHHAHIASVMAERGLRGEVFGLAWDGYGFGLDREAWGGEALITSEHGFRRFAHLSPFRLPGADTAAREPRRSALGLLHATLGREAPSFALGLFDEDRARALFSAMDRGFSSPYTTSVGRLFDAIAALLGGKRVASYEGQAAMELEHLAETNVAPIEPYPLPLSDTSSPLVVDLAPLVRSVLRDVSRGRPTAEIAAAFHVSLAELALRLSERAGLSRVILSGGCFQNGLLSRLVVGRLERAGFTVFLPGRIPVNDGGISAGQALVASALATGQSGQSGRKEDGCA